jgi:RloB-like protein
VESDFDPNWKDYIHVAYSCISFETWLLLHFEICTTSFYNSREIIHYFDKKGYFMDKKANTKFEKGWYLYENRDENVLKDFFNKIDKAIKNNIRLSVLQTQDTPFYEINPYSDVFKLTAQLTAITICYENQKLAKWADFKNIYLEKQINEQTLLYLTYKGKATLMIDSEINLTAENGKITLLSDNIVRTNDTIKIQIVGQQLLFYKISYKNQVLCGTIK